MPLTFLSGYQSKKQAYHVDQYEKEKGLEGLKAYPLANLAVRHGGLGVSRHRNAVNVAKCLTFKEVSIKSMHSQTWLYRKA